MGLFFSPEDSSKKNPTIEPGIVEYLEKYFRNMLESEVVERIVATSPRPAAPALATPTIDQFAINRLGKDNARRADTRTFHTQDALLKAVGHLVELWQMVLSTAAAAGTLVAAVQVPASILLQKVQKSLVILRSASSRLTVERRSRLLAANNPRLTDLATCALQHKGS